MINRVEAVRLQEFLAYVRNHPKQWPMARIVRESKLSRDSVIRALRGENVSMRVLLALVKVFGGEVLIAVNVAPNLVRVD